MNYTKLLLPILLLCLISCSKKVAFRDLQIGMSTKELLTSETCKKDGIITGKIISEEKNKNVITYLCSVVTINNNKFATMAITHDDKLIRVAVIFANYSMKDVEDIFLSINAKYGKPSGDLNTFLGRFKSTDYAIQIGATPLNPNTTWNNDTVQMYYDGKDTYIYYQIEDYYNSYAKLGVNTKEI